MGEQGQPVSLLKKSVNTVVFCILSLIILLPLAYVVIVSISDQKLYNKNLFSFVHSAKLENYAIAWQEADILNNGINTIVVSFLAIVFVVIAASLAAFAVKIYKYKEIGFIYYILVSSMFIPIQAVILPLFQHLKNLHLLNSSVGLALIYAAVNLPISFMMFVGFYKTIPVEIVEAATIDGCRPLGIFMRIILPLSKSIIATVTILTGLNICRDFFIPLVTLTDTSKYTLGVGLLAFRDEYSTDWTKMFAAMIIQSVPLIILFLGLQKYFVKGVVAGSVKG